MNGVYSKGNPNPEACRFHSKNLALAVAKHSMTVPEGVELRRDGLSDYANQLWQSVFQDLRNRPRKHIFQPVDPKRLQKRLRSKQLD